MKKGKSRSIKKAEKRREKLIKEIQRARELQEELRKLGIDNPSLMDTLVFQTLGDIRSDTGWLKGALSIGFSIVIGLLIALAVVVF